MVVNICVSYAPFAFQRKLLQGAHFPIALLAGVGAAWLWARMNRTAGAGQFPLYASAVTAALCLTNVRFLVREINNFQQGVAQTKQHRTYLQPGEIQALNWLRAHSAPGDAVQPLPWIGRASTDTGTRLYTRDVALMYFTPGMTGRRVYCGHWGETPDYNGKLSLLNTFQSSSGRMTEADRADFLRSMKVRYLVFSQKESSDDSPETAEDADSLVPVFRGRLPLPGYLYWRYGNADADVYEVVGG
jgi:hypothetical protein